MVVYHIYSIQSTTTLKLLLMALLLSDHRIQWGPNSRLLFREICQAINIGLSVRYETYSLSESGNCITGTVQRIAARNLLLYNLHLIFQRIMLESPGFHSRGRSKALA